MKDKLITLIIGILIGAIIATLCFIVINRAHVRNNRGERPDFGEMRVPQDMKKFEDDERMRDRRREIQDENLPEPENKKSDSNTDDLNKEIPTVSTENNSL